MKEKFFSKFPEYRNRDDAETIRAFSIFSAGFLSAGEKESGNTLFLINEPVQEKTDVVSDVLDHLNQARRDMAGNQSLRGFKKTKTVEGTIKARIKEGFTKDEFFTVIDHKCSEWRGTKFQEYIRPSTLFAPSHFQEYLLAAESKKKVNRSSLDQQIDGLMG